MDEINIKWDDGEYNLIVEEFFPATGQKAKAVFTAMAEDPAWDEERIKEFADHLVGLAEEARFRGLNAEKELLKLNVERVDLRRRHRGKSFAMNEVQKKYDEVDYERKEFMKKADGLHRNWFNLMMITGLC